MYKNNIKNCCINATKITCKMVFLIILGVFVTSCSNPFSKKTAENQENKLTKKKRFEPDLAKRSREEMGKSIFSSGPKKEEYTFASDNIIWRASLNALKKLPLSEVNYSGGVLVTDWYGNSPKESLKITVIMKSPDVKASSLEIVSHKKICDETMIKCQIKKGSDSFNQKIKDAILEEARILSIDKVKK